MKRIKSIFAMTAAMLLTFAPSSSAKTITMTHTVNEFKGISASNNIEVQYTQGPLKPLTITLDEKDKDKISIQVVDNILRIKNAENKRSISGFKASKIVVKVQSPKLVAIDFSAGAEFTSKGPIKNEGAFAIDTSSGADVEITNLSVSDLAVRSASGSDVEISNVVANSSTAIETSSGADVTLKNFKTGTVSVSASSGSDVSLTGKAELGAYTATSGADISADKFYVDQLSAIASSAASIKAWGKTATIKKSSGGKVKLAK